MNVTREDGSARTVALLGATEEAAKRAETEAAKGAEVYVVEPRAFAGGQEAASYERPASYRRELDARLSACATVLYLSHCAGILEGEGAFRGVLLANPFGTQILRTDDVIDCTGENALALLLSGSPGVQEAEATVLFEAETDGEAGDASPRKGTRRSRFAKAFSFDPADPFWRARLEREARAEAPDQCLRTFGAEAKLVYVGQAYVRAPKLAARKPWAGETRLTSWGKTLEIANERPFGDLPFLTACDVFPANVLRAGAFLAGVGTGGAMALRALSDEGIDLLALDANLMPGGTTTVGMVTGNWHGYQHGAFAARNKAVAEIAARDRCAFALAAARYWDEPFQRGDGARHRDSVAANFGGVAVRCDDRASPVGDCARFGGEPLSDGAARFIGGGVLCSARGEGRKVQCAVVYAPGGFYRAEADVYIDATADAALIGFAGGARECGDPETGFVQSASQWGADPTRPASFHQSATQGDIDVQRPGSYADILRCLRLATALHGDYRASDMLTPRESHRVVGRARLTLEGIVLRRHTPDALSVGACLPDNHGRMSSDLLTLGFFSCEPTEDGDYRFAIPRGAFVPEGIDNALVAGKAICSDRDANCLSRMNPDVTNAGYAVGLLAAEALRRAEAPGDVDLRGVQARLREIGSLPDWASDVSRALTIDDAMALLKEGRVAPAICQPKDVMLPLLREALSGGNACAAEALAYFGAPDGFPKLAERLKARMKEDIAVWEDDGTTLTLTNRAGERFQTDARTSYGKPDAAKLAPYAAYREINRLIVLAARSGDPRAVSSILPYLSLSEAGPMVVGQTPYAISRIDAWRHAFHDRLFALATALRLRPDPRAAQGLQALLEKPGVGGHFPQDAAQKRIPFQPTYLELLLRSALRRCGGGAAGLEACARDPRGVFAEAARRELAIFSR